MDRASCDVLFAAIGDGRRYKTAGEGQITMLPTSAFEELTGRDSPCLSVRKLGAEQSNTSIIIGDAFLFKLYRKLEEGLNPDVEMGLFLTEQKQFTGIAPVVGTVRYTDPAGHDCTLGMLQKFIPNRGDGWSYALSTLEDYYRQIGERLAKHEGTSPKKLFPEDVSRNTPPAFFPSMTGEFLQAVRTLARRTAEFHLALSNEQRNRLFKPEKANRAFTGQLAEAIAHEAGQALALLSSKFSDLPSSIRKDADHVLIEGPSLIGKVDQFAEIGEDLGMLIRIHGDYHLGQVLRTNDDDFILLDFEGEPLRPLAERRRKGSPLKDVAGMIRSFHYAAHTGLSKAQEAGANGKQLKPWSRIWHDWSSAVFLNVYLDTTTGEPFLPSVDPELILEIFLLEKVFYELKYELNNRPDWVSIPLAGIMDIIKRKKG